MRCSAALLLVASITAPGCAPRGLDTADAGSPSASTSSDGGSVAAICGQPAVVLARDVWVDTEQLAQDGDRIYYSTQDPSGESISGIPMKGGAAEVVNPDDAAQWLTVFQQYVLYAQTNVVDVDLSAGTARTFPNPEGPAPVVATADEIVLVDADLERIARGDGTVTHVPLPVPLNAYGMASLALIGRSVVYLGNDQLAHAYDLDTGTFSTVGPSDFAASTLAASGDELLLLNASALLVLRLDGTETTRLPFAYPDDFIATFDDQAVYTVGIDPGAAIHVTPRDGDATCALGIVAPGATGLLAADDALFVVAPLPGDASSIDQLLRVDE